MRLAPLKPMPKTPMPHVPAAAARSGADDFAGAVAARAAQKTAKPEYVFRGDGQHPNDVFKQGFQAQGNNMDLYNHAATNFNSGYVATSKTPNIARDFAYENDGFVYTIKKPSNGVDVNKSLGEISPNAHEKEIAIPNSISSENIKGARKVNENGRFTGSFIPNPTYRK